MTYQEGQKRGKGPSQLDAVLADLNAREQIRLEQEAQEDEQFPKPEIIFQDLDIVGLRIPGARQPLVFALHFKDNNAHTAFLSSERDLGALALHRGKIIYETPHEQVLEDQEWERKIREYRESHEGEVRANDPDQGNKDLAEDVEDYKLMQWYGLPVAQIKSARRFATRAILNKLREGVEKLPV